MTSLFVFQALFPITVLSLLSIWFFVIKKTYLTIGSENQSADPVSLPKGWYTNAERFQVERRAIFSQTWMCVSHRGRFIKPGDYIVYNVAGFRILMILGKDKTVRSFHNVCRHRAFPVARKDYGSATVLGCRYHGWSYDYTGRLIKAPYFDNKPGFDKSTNNLFGISTKEDKNGFLYINPGTDPRIAKMKLPQGAVTGRLSNITPDTNQLHSFEVDVDEFGSSSTVIPAIEVTKFFRTFLDTTEDKVEVFPLTAVHIASYSNCWYQMTYNPVSATKTSVRCDVYSEKGSEISQVGKTTRENLEQEVMQRIQGLEAKQKEMTTLGYDVISMSHHQNRIASVVDDHIEQERILGYEIKPAEVKAQPNDQMTAKAESLCAAIECGDKKLDW